MYDYFKFFVQIFMLSTHNDEPQAQPQNIKWRVKMKRCDEYGMTKSKARPHLWIYIYYIEEITIWGHKTGKLINFWFFWWTLFLIDFFLYWFRIDSNQSWVGTGVYEKYICMVFSSLLQTQPIFAMASLIALCCSSGKWKHINFIKKSRKKNQKWTNLIFYSIIFQNIMQKIFNFADFKKHGFYSN